MAHKKVVVAGATGPVLIVGETIGGAMDLIPPLGVYAAMMREQGRALDYPGGAARVSRAVDVDLLARAIAWAGEADAARNQAFNVTNGDVFTWENVWPAIAEALDMKPGVAAPLSLVASHPQWIAPWEACATPTRHIVRYAHAHKGEG